MQTVDELAREWALEISAILFKDSIILRRGYGETNIEEEVQNALAESIAAKLREHDAERDKKLADLQRDFFISVKINEKFRAERDTLTAENKRLNERVEELERAGGAVSRTWNAFKSLHPDELPDDGCTDNVENAVTALQTTVEKEGES